ncbi:cystathionine beta-synthase [Mycetocola sp. BIGb0189]|uniref:cystathionine beta-synthase n=1 Tax=unclassified Mycetocola TaxID=2685235 RepID=UPI00165D0E0D|nr:MULTISPECIES: cystathionine beta-synthase [unclassified Mycetocola]MCS4276313.1 cystathionine beta-synthase [Mycetocola sp. BIGb0189]
MKYAESVVDLIGNTPLVKLNRVTEGITATVLVKVEYLNPGGSVKDRVALKMITEAEKSGELLPGGTIVEPTSGNTGVGLALVAQQRGYQCVFVTPDKVGEEKRDVLRAYGAEVVVTPTSVSPDSPQSYYAVSDRLTAEIPGAYKPNQFFNDNGPLSHYESTGPEIWRDTDGKVTHFVAGAGTGGTISGAARYLREVSNDGVRIIAADPEGSIYSGGTGRPYLVEGVGEDMWPGTYHPELVDEAIAIDDAESFAMTRRLAREEGLLVGGSSGMAVAAGLRVARTLGPDDVMVILLPDSGRGYLTKVFNDGWMRDFGYDHGEGETLASVLPADVSAALPRLAPADTVTAAGARLRELGLPALPIITTTADPVLGEVWGAVRESDLLAGLLAGEITAETAVDRGIGAPIATIGSGRGIAEARVALEEHGILLVLTDGKPVAILTPGILIDALAAKATA